MLNGETVQLIVSNDGSILQVPQFCKQGIARWKTDGRGRRKEERERSLDFPQKMKSKDLQNGESLANVSLRFKVHSYVVGDQYLRLHVKSSMIEQPKEQFHCIRYYHFQSNIQATEETNDRRDNEDEMRSCHDRIATEPWCTRLIMSLIINLCFPSNNHQGFQERLHGSIRIGYGLIQRAHS